MHNNSITRHFAALAADPSTSLGRMFGTGPRLPEPEGEGGGTGEGNEGDEGNDEGGDDGGGHDRHLRSAIAERDKAKSKLRETEARLAEFEERDRKAAEDREREAGDWSKLEARYQKRLEAETARADELQAKLEAMEGGQRRGAFAKAIAKQAGLSSADVVERLVPTLGLPDDAPEAFNAIDVRTAAKALRDQVPELFAAGSSDPKPPPGGGDPPKDKNSSDYWRQKAASRSQVGRNAAYDHATGRGPK